MRRILMMTLLLLMSAAMQAGAEDASLLGELPKGEEALRALPGATLGKQTETEDGGHSQILTYRGAKIDIRTASDGTRSFSPADGMSAPPVLCLWQIAIAQEAVREHCAPFWGENAVKPAVAAKALEAMETYIQQNNVMPVTADYVRAERDRLAAPTKAEFAAADPGQLQEICGYTLMYTTSAFQPMVENGEPAWQTSIAKPAPVLASLCN